jgi:hypothetical protein
MNGTADDYRMNPAEDTLLRGDQLADGMWVLAENIGLRLPLSSNSEDDRIRAQRFRQVSGLRRKAASSADGTPELIHFTGTWVDGYQATHTTNLGTPWIVKKGAVNAEAVAEARNVADMCRSGYARHAESATALGLSAAPEPGPVFETAEGGAFTIMRSGRAYRVTVVPAEGEG